MFTRTSILKTVQDSGVQFDNLIRRTGIRGEQCLCDRLMNRLLKAAGMPTVLYRTKAPSSFVALSNIESFVAAAKAFGVPETSLFQPSDLVDGRKGPLLFVLNCINQLGIIVR